jgi:transposase
MAFREVHVFEVREVLRLWLRGEGFRGVERLSGVDRKTVRRYITAALEVGLDRSGGEEQLNDGLIALVVERVRPHRFDGHGAAWRSLDSHRDQIKAWIQDEGLTVVKVRELLARRGVVVPQRTLTRYAGQLCGPRRGQRTTVRVADGEPGDECQVDFGRMGKLFDPDTARTRICHALIFTACYSRHGYVWLSFSQTTEAVIEGFEAAWAFFGGVFGTVIPDNLAAVVDKANPIEPRLNQAFVEYAQDRGCAIDAARVRHPQDKPRVERAVPYVRQSFFAGENFIDLADAQRRAEEWCRTTAGLRIHGTTQCRPAELFALEEAACLGPAPEAPYDVPLYARPKVHRDHHCEVAKALYSVPGNLIGHHLEPGPTEPWSSCSSVEDWSRSIPANRRADARPMSRTCPRTRASMPCETSIGCNGWPPATAWPSVPMPRRCWSTRCRGPRCARSMPSSAWSRSGEPTEWTRPAPRHWRPRPSTSA